MIGEMIGDDYRVEELIGEGSFGTVYKCEDKNLDQLVAVKMLRGASRDPKALDRFLKEARILASINHPNVIRIFRLGYQEETPFIVMEFLTGQVLTRILERSRPSLKHGLDIMRQIASGLKAIHDKGIVHRDLSSNNVMTTVDNTVKILDLGLAKDIKAFSTISREGYFVGTMAYVAPEQIEGQPASPASDAFAFGILLYEMVTGKHPFHAEHHMSLLYNIGHRDPESLDHYLQNPPPALVTLVDACLNKSPDERLSDLGEAERVLSGIATDPGLESGEQRVSQLSTTPVRTVTRNPYLHRTMLRHHQDFYGRTHEVKRIFARLNTSPPGSVSIVGDRKIGKSSLMNYVYMRHSRETFLEDPERMIMVFLDLQEEKSMTTAAFVRLLVKMVELELRGRLEVSDCSEDLDGIKELVQRLHANGFRLAILFDEFDAVTSNPNFDLETFSFLRYLANHYDVGYLTSSAKNLQVLCHTKEISDSPFFNIFSTMRLSVFRREEAEQLIREPSARVGKPLAPYTSQLVGMAGYFPFFLQMACSHAIDFLEENPGLNEPDFAEVRHRFYEEAKLHFRHTWSNLDEHEQSALMRVAKEKSVPDALKHVLQELAGRHLVELEDGKPRLFAPTFSEFLEEVTGAGKGSLLRRLFGRSG